MSTRMVCDICGRGIVADAGYARLSVFENHISNPTRHYDLCTARNGHDVGCAQFVRAGIEAMKDKAQEAAKERGVPLP